MKSWFPSSLLALAALAHGKTVWQQRNVSFDVPTSTLGIFSSNFTSKSEALTSFEAAFDSSKIARNGDTRYGATIARVWTQQRKTWPEMILYPETAEDVSVIMQFYSAAYSFWGDDGFAISQFYPQPKCLPCSKSCEIVHLTQATRRSSLRTVLFQRAVDRREY